MYEERIMGFDCREMWIPESETKNWQDKSGVMNSNVERILTINPYSWASVFLPYGQKFSDRTASGYHLAVLPEWMTPKNYWRDFKAMKKFIIRHKEQYRKRCWMIGISIVLTPKYYYGEDRDRMPQIEDIEPSPEWTLLGYDVEDYAFFNGGLGMRWIEEYEKERRELWGSRLNRYHLFPQQKDALEYAAWQDNGGHGYGTLLAFGLYLIQEFRQPAANG